MSYIRFRVELWFRETRSKLQWKAAYALPRQIALLAFVRVYSVLDYCGDDYDRAYLAFAAGQGN